MIVSCSTLNAIGLNIIWPVGKSTSVGAMAVRIRFVPNWPRGKSLVPSLVSGWKAPLLNTGVAKEPRPKVLARPPRTIAGVPSRVVFCVIGRGKAYRDRTLLAPNGPLGCSAVPSRVVN